jgi:hypothetical protein
MHSHTILFCPFEPAINPTYERACEASTQWALDYGLLRPGAAEARFRGLRIPEFVARAYPRAQYEDLRVVMDWTLWGFLADDQHDLLVDRPELVRARYLEHVEVLENGLVDQLTGMHHALADLRDRIVQRGSTSCLRRFTESASQWFDSMYTEVRNRSRITPPSLLDYLRLREITVGMYTEYALFDVTHQVRTTDDFWIDPDIRRLEAMAANIIGWANDIFSFRKERSAGDPHNMVLLLGAERGLRPEEAVDRTAAMHDREMTRFLELMDATRRSKCVPSELLEPFLGLLVGWVRGNLDWAYSSERYGLDVVARSPAPAREPTTPLVEATPGL